MIVEFQAVETHSTGLRTISLGAYDDVVALPTPGMKVQLILSGADAPYADGSTIFGTVSASMPGTIYVPNQGIDAMIFLENVSSN